MAVLYLGNNRVSPAEIVFHMLLRARIGNPVLPVDQKCILVTAGRERNPHTPDTLADRRQFNFPHTAPTVEVAYQGHVLGLGGIEAELQRVALGRALGSQS